MKQAILVEPRHLVFREAEAPRTEDLAEHEILLRIRRIGICGSEIHSYHGQHPATFYPVVQGHEYAAEAVAVGRAVATVRPGDIVTARPQLVCGTCGPCRRGQYNVCENLRVQAFQADGAAQEYFVVDEERVVRIPDSVPLDFAAMVEPVAVGAHATRRAGDLTGKNVVVSGAGTIGNLVAQFALARHARKVLITDVSDVRLAKARECGIDGTLNIKHTPLEVYARDFFGGEGYQVAFEVAGVESSLRSLMGSIEKGGRIVVVAVFAHDPALSMFHLGEHELEMIGTMMYRHEDFECAVEKIADGSIRLAPLISAHFAFDRFADAYRYIDDNPTSSMKVMIDL